MDKSLALILLNDLETSLNIIAFAVAEKNTILAQEALANAELEVAAIRRIIEEPPSHSRHIYRS